MEIPKKYTDFRESFNASVRDTFNIAMALVPKSITIRNTTARKSYAELENKVIALVKKCISIRDTTTRNSQTSRHQQQKTRMTKNRRQFQIRLDSQITMKPMSEEDDSYYNIPTSQQILPPNTPSKPLNNTVLHRTHEY